MLVLDDSNTYLGLEGLRNAAKEYLEDPQNSEGKRQKGRSVPSVSTIRYYLSEKLIDAPILDRKKGPHLVFERKHLLQLLAVKKLQRDVKALSINAIKEVISGKSEEFLEKLLKETDIKVLTEWKQYDDFKKNNPNIPEDQILKIYDPESRLKHLAELDRSRGDLQNEDIRVEVAEKVVVANSEEPFVQPEMVSWRRIVLWNGLELHIADGFKPPATSEQMESIVERFRALVSGQRPRRHGGEVV